MALLWYQDAQREINEAKAETQQAQGLVATLQTALSTVQDTVKEKYESQLTSLKEEMTKMRETIKEQAKALQSRPSRNPSEAIAATLEGKSDKEAGEILNQIAEAFNKQDAELEARKVAKAGQNNTRKPK